MSDLFSIQLDLSSWMRGPYSGVGRSAVLAAMAIQENLKSDPSQRLHLPSFMQRSVTQEVRREFRRTMLRIEPLNPWQQIFGAKKSLYHSFEHSIPPLLRSKRVITLHDCWTLRKNLWQSETFQSRQRPRLMRALRRSHQILVPTRATLEALESIDSSLAEKARIATWGPTLDVSNSLLAAQTTITPMRTVMKDISPHFEENHSADGTQHEFEKIKNSGAPYVLYVANIENRKNHTILLKALKKIHGITLVLAGDFGWGHENILPQIEELKTYGRKVHLFRKLEEDRLIWLYKNCMALVSSSFEEGFGLPVLEAMSLAKPVLLSRIAAHEEVAADAAIYFDPNLGLSELCELLMALRDDSYFARELSDRSLKRAEKFSWTSYAQKVREVYLEALQ